MEPRRRRRGHAPLVRLALAVAGALATLQPVALAAPAPGAWVHPGVLMSRQQLAFVRASIAARAEPFWGQWNKFLKTWQATDGARYPQGPPLSGTIECGSYSVPDYGCSVEGRDGVVAYMQALMWAIAGNVTSAATSARILNAYATGVRKYNNSNAPLQCSWGALKMVRAAEILRHTGAPTWPDSDAVAFGRWQTTVQVPYLWGGSTSNGNWELSFIEAMIGIAVYNENATLFDRAVGMWRQRAPAYLYYSPWDGGKPVPAPRGTASWYGQTVYNGSTSGICQETCRDMGHTGMGVASLVNAAETAWIQGTNLYGEQAGRIVAGLEFNTPLMASNASIQPALLPLLCGGLGVMGGQPPMGDIAYNHYARRVRLPPGNLTHTADYVFNVTRPKSNPSDSLIMQWESLTHGDDWNATPANAALAVVPAAWATASPTGSRSSTPSVTPTGSASLSPGATPSGTPSPTGTGPVWVARFQPGALVVLRGGTPGATAPSTTLAQPLALVETDARTGEARTTVPLPAARDAATGAPACTLGYSSAGYQLEGFLQRSWDAAVVAVPCNDVPAGSTQPTNVSARVVAVLRADGSVDTSTRVTTAFRDSTTATQFRTAATLDGTGFWLTGSTSSAGSAGLHYVPLGGSASTLVTATNAANQRYVHVGPPPLPSTAGAGASPQLYVSFRDPLASRGIAAVVGATSPVGTTAADPLPTAPNASTPLLPGFAAAYPASTTAANTSLIGSFVWEPGGATLWACDTQAWQAGVTPALPEKPNLVRYDWNGSAWVRTDALPLDPPNGTAYAGQQVVQCTGRWEEDVTGAGAASGNASAGRAGFVVYATNSAKLLRVDTAARDVRLLATAPAGTFFYGVSAAPYRADISPAPASITRSATVTGTRTRDATPTNTRTVPASASASRSGTATGTSTGTGSRSATPSSTASAASGSGSPVAVAPSVTPSLSASWDGGASPAAAASLTPSATVPASASVPASVPASATPPPSTSATPSWSGSGTGSPTRSPTPSRSAAATATPTATRSATGTVSPSGSVPPSGTGSQTRSGTGSGSRSASGSAAPTSSGSASGTGTPPPSGSGSSSAGATRTSSSTAMVSPSWSGSPSRSGSPSGTGTPSGAPTPPATTSPTAAATGTATGSTSASATGSVSATASPPPSGSDTATGSPPPTASPSLSPAATRSRSKSALPSSSGTKSGAPTGSSTGTATGTRTRSRSRTRTRTRTRTRSAVGSPSASVSRSRKPKRA